MASTARAPQSERRLSPSVMAALVAAIHAEPLQRRAAIRTTCETDLLCTALAFRANSRAVNAPDHVNGGDTPGSQSGGGHDNLRPREPQAIFLLDRIMDCVLYNFRRQAKAKGREMGQKEGARAFEGLRCNPPREVETEANFFIPIGRNPLKSPDSKK
jgi:hypothetical protein